MSLRLPACLLEHGQCFLAGALGGGLAAEHEGQLVHAIGVAQGGDRGCGSSALGLLADDPLTLRVASNLGQVGDADDLVMQR